MGIDPTFMPPEAFRTRKRKLTKLTEAEMMVVKISSYLNLTGGKEISQELFKELETLAATLRDKRR